jgi:SAM-dependent methyltransferase
MHAKAATDLASVRRFSDYVDVYDKHRPVAPQALCAVLMQYADNDEPGLVVDNGCGTGLATRYWADRAHEVIGVDPSEEMIRYAAATTRASNVSYRIGPGHQTGLEDDCADVVVCSNSLHWMEPEPTLQEVARLLRPGGVFAAFYHDQYPLTSSWEADRLFHTFRERAIALDRARGITARARRFPREEHLPLMQASGLFRHARQMCLHQADSGNADRLIGLTGCDGFVRSLLKAGVSEAELGLPEFRSEARRLLGDEPRPWFWYVYLWIGVV